MKKRVFKVVALILTVVMTMTLLSIRFMPVSATEIQLQYEAGDVYNSLDDAAAYIKEQMIAREENISVSISNNAVSDINSAVYELVDKAVEYKRGDSGKAGDALKSAMSSWKCSCRGDVSSYVINFNVTYHTTQQQESVLTGTIDNVLANLELEGKTTYEKIKTIYDYICDNVDYDYEGLADSSNKIKYTAYSALINGKAVCEGYAALFYRMCMDAGIPVRIIEGIGNGGAHAWNIVEINGFYYNVDVTWDGQDAETRHDYFLRSDADFGDHDRDDEYKTAEFYTAFSMSENSYSDNSGAEIKHNHIYSGEWSKDAKSHWHACVAEGCAESNTDGLVSVIDKAAHTAGNWFVDIEATEEHEGSRHKECTVCGYVMQTESIDKIDEPSQEEPEEPEISLTEVPEGYIGIYNSSELKDIQQEGKYILMDDIELDGNQTISDQFNGIFDGNYHTIRRNQCDQYLIYEIGMRGVIKNLKVEMLVSETSIEYDEDGWGTYVHFNNGIVCKNRGIITGCKINVIDERDCKVVKGFGIAQCNYGEISHCQVTMLPGENATDFSVVAITADNNQKGVVSDCILKGKTSSSMVGSNVGYIADCINYANISGYGLLEVGAIADFSLGIIINSRNEGNIEYSGKVGCVNRCGGIVGENCGAIIGCENTGRITLIGCEERMYLGGIAGVLSEGVIIDSKSNGELIAKEGENVRAIIGGIVGRTDNGLSQVDFSRDYSEYVYIENCSNDAKISFADEHDILSGNIIGETEGSVVLKNSGSVSDIGKQWDDTENYNIVVSGDDNNLAVDQNFVELSVGTEYSWLKDDYDNVKYIMYNKFVSANEGKIKALEAGTDTIVAVDLSTGKSNYLVVRVIDVPFAWNINDGVLTIYGTGDMPMPSANDKLWSERKDEIKKIVISEGITSVSQYAFSNCQNLTCVELPNSLKIINSYAFYLCEKLDNVDLKKISSIMQGAFCQSGLRNVIIPGTVTFLDYDAFGGCNSLTDVYFEKKADEVNRIQIYAPFRRCKSLEAICVSDERKDLVSIDGALYGVHEKSVDFNGYYLPKNSLRLLMYPCGRNAEEFRLPDKVSLISYYALGNGYKKLILNEGLVYICSSDVYNIDMLTIPSTLEYAELSIRHVSRVVNNSCLDLEFDKGFGEVYYSETDNRPVDKLYANDSYYMIQMPDDFRIVESSVNEVVYPGNKVQLEIDYSPSDAVLGKILWSTADESIATVDQNGLVTAVSEGMTQITATLAAFENITACYSITVMAEHEHVFRQWNSDKDYHWRECCALGCAQSSSEGKVAIADKALHIAGEWIVDKRPTVQSEGSRHKECIVCGYKVEIESIPKLETEIPFQKEVITFVEGLYSNVLSRDATIEEVDSWTEALQSGRCTAVQATEGFIFGEEYESKDASNEAFVKMLYCTLLEREPQQSEVEDMLKFFDSGVTRRYIYSIFVSSNEFTTKCSNMNLIPGEVVMNEYRDQNIGVTRFVVRCYEKILKRQYDIEGLNGWCSALLSNNMSPAEVAAAGFIHSDEFESRKISNAEFVRILYRTFMDREPDQGGFEYWTKELSEGMSKDYIINGFLESQEFTDICTSYGMNKGKYNLTAYKDQNAGVTKFVVRLYRNALGREPEESGLNGWCECLLSGTKAPVDVAKEGFFHSEEFINKELDERQFIETLYRTFMGREADMVETVGWINCLYFWGWTRDAVIDQFAGSQEFKNIMAQYGL